jgi:hypothetical protein
MLVVQGEVTKFAINSQPNIEGFAWLGADVKEGRGTLHQQDGAAMLGQLAVR